MESNFVLGKVDILYLCVTLCFYEMITFSVTVTVITFVSIYRTYFVLVMH